MNLPDRDDCECDRASRHAEEVGRGERGEQFFLFFLSSRPREKGQNLGLSSPPHPVLNLHYHRRNTSIAMRCCSLGGAARVFGGAQGEWGRRLASPRRALWLISSKVSKTLGLDRPSGSCVAHCSFQPAHRRVSKSRKAAAAVEDRKRRCGGGGGEKKRDKKCCLAESVRSLKRKTVFPLHPPRTLFSKHENT